MIAGFIAALKVLQFHTVHLRSRSRILKWQERHLRMMVRHAIQNVPIYTELYSRAGIDGSTIKTLHDIERLPILNKQTFIGRPADEHTDNSRPFWPVWESTSGTSGTPFTFLLGRNALNTRYLDSICFRFLTWLQPWRMEFSRVKVARIKIRSRSSPYRLFIPVAAYLSDPNAAVRSLAAFQPYVLESYASILLMLANFVESNSELPKIRPGFIVSFGEILTPAAREQLRTVFRCDVYDRYGIEEMSVVACECRLHNGQHVHSESIIAEVVDKSGKQLPDGEYGRIVLTDLTNTNMPFLRYETGDYGRMTWEPCSCGLKTPRVWFEGRHAAFIVIKGKTIHHLEFDAALDTFMHVIRQYQIAKVSDSGIEIRITIGDRYIPDDEGRILSAIRSLVGEGVQLTVKIMDEIPVTPRGKCKILVDECSLTNS